MPQIITSNASFTSCLEAIGMEQKQINKQTTTHYNV